MKTPFKSFGFQAQSIITSAMLLNALIGLAMFLPAAQAAPQHAKSVLQQPIHTQPQFQLKLIANQQESERKRFYQAQMDAKLKNIKQVDRQDLLVVTPNAKSDKVEISDACVQVKSEVLLTVGFGETTIMIVKAEHGKASQTQQKLLADGHFSSVDTHLLLP